MPTTNEDIIARQFFDLADKVTEISDSDSAQAVESFTEEDYISVVATLLDAAYWILAGQLDDEISEQPLGHPLYVRSMVYNDLLYRGFDPMIAWDESGMADLFGEGDKVSIKESSTFGPGDYVAFTDDGGTRSGMLLSSDKLFSFDGSIEAFSVVDKKGIKKLTANQAAILRSHYGESLITIVRDRYR